MEYNIYDAKKHFSRIIQTLLDGEEDQIVILKNGKPVVRMTMISKKCPKRVGIAKKEMEGFDISLDEFNSIPTLDFGL